MCLFSVIVHLHAYMCDYSAESQVGKNSYAHMCYIGGLKYLIWKCVFVYLLPH